MRSHFQRGRENDISAEQWSPVAAVGDAPVTEMLTPLVNVATNLLTSQILQVSCKFKTCISSAQGDKSLTSSCMFRQEIRTKRLLHHYSPMP